MSLSTHDSTPAAAAQFGRAVTAVGGVCTYAPTLHAGVAAVRDLLGAVAQSGSAPLRIGVSDAPLARAMTEALQRTHPNGAWQFPPEGPRRDLEQFDLDVGLTGAQWGIAETGTLVLSTTHERNRRLSLVPPIHVALLNERDIRPTAAAALAELGDQMRANGHPAGSAVTFITGPSRTSDIELTLVLGAHGPRALYVIIIGDDTNLDIP